MNSRWAAVCAAIMIALNIGCSGGTPDEPEGAPAVVPQPAAAVSSIDGYEVITVADGGSITGSITVSGAIQKLPGRQINKDPKVCGAPARDSQQLITGGTGGLKNAVVMVEGVRRGKTVPAAALDPRIDQKDCEYVPHIQVMPLNTEITVLNSDPVLHTIHFYQDDETLFNIAQPVQGQLTKRKLEKAGFVYVECDVHGWMQAHVAVADNPYHAVTDENGRFSITDLPAGAYRVKIWHEYLGETTREITVAATADTSLNVDLRDLLAKKNPAPITAAPAPAGAAAPAAAAPDAKAAAGEVVIQMQSDGGTFRFEPANLTIKAGTTVKWINTSDNRHTATDDPKFEKADGQAVLPAGVEPWTTPFLPNGETATYTFTVPGKYQYFCRNHAQFGMVAGITVVP